MFVGAIVFVEDVAFIGLFAIEDYAVEVFVEFCCVVCAFAFACCATVREYATVGTVSADADFHEK